MSSWRVDEILRQIERLSPEEEKELKEAVALHFGWMPIGNILVDLTKLKPVKEGK